MYIYIVWKPWFLPPFGFGGGSCKMSHYIYNSGTASSALTAWAALSRICAMSLECLLKAFDDPPHEAGNIYPVIRKLEWIAPISKSKSSCFPEMNLPASMESLSIPHQFSSRYTLRKAVQCMRSCTKLRNLQKIALQMQDLKQSEVWFWSSKFWPKMFHFWYMSPIQHHSTMWLCLKMGSKPPMK